MAGPNLEDYVDVPERIRAFKQAYPNGSLQRVGNPEILTVGDKSFIVYTAMAYRTPDDERPGVGTAWEPVPGTTAFTRNSELQNAETSAWGRAIIAAMLEPANGKIASREEVRNRAAEGGSGEGVASEPRSGGSRAKGSNLNADAPSPQLSVDDAEALAQDLEKIGIEKRNVGLWLATKGVKKQRSFVETLRLLSPEQGLELKAWAAGELEGRRAFELSGPALSRKVESDG